MKKLILSFISIATILFGIVSSQVTVLGPPTLVNQMKNFEHSGSKNNI